MVVSINRTWRQINISVMLVRFPWETGSSSDPYRYCYVPSSAIDNFDEIQWHGTEFNRLFVKDNVLYRFVKWVGNFPFDGITIEEIGRIQG